MIATELVELASRYFPDDRVEQAWDAENECVEDNFSDPDPLAVFIAAAAAEAAEDVDDDEGQRQWLVRGLETAIENLQAVIDGVLSGDCGNPRKNRNDGDYVYDDEDRG